MNTTINGINISYPDLGFAFNPIRVILTNYTEISAKIRIGDIELEREVYAGADHISFDLSAIAQSMFDRFAFHKVERKDENLIKNIDFILNDGTSDFYSGTIPTIWGALQIGETFRQSKELICFRGYPFTVPLYVDGEVILEAAEGGNITPMGGFTSGKYNIPFNADLFKSKAIIKPVGESRYGIFDYTFDYTFRPQIVTASSIPDLAITVNIADCPSDGVYLRWINQYGEYNYYLFSASVSTLEVKNEDIVLENIFYSTELEDNYHFGVGKTIGKSITKSQKLFASLIDSNTFNLLLGLAKSPIVDMFAGYSLTGAPQWINVSVKDGSFAKSTSNLQDFECYLIPNDEFIQTL